MPGEFPMPWKTVDTQRDLDGIDRSVCWEDARTLEYFAKLSNEPYFPTDVSRSGYELMNVNVLCSVPGSPSPFIELVFIDSDRIALDALVNLSMHGRVDGLKRVELLGPGDSLKLRCSRLIYRFLAREEVPSGSYFRTADSIT
jgi:hypothetical protein